MPRRRQPSELDEVRRAVAAYVAAGADESVQRVVIAVRRLSRRLDQWYDRQLADLELSAAEWAVLSELARGGDAGLTPGQLAAASQVAPSSMTHRLDRLVQRGLVTRSPDPDNRTRVLVRLSAAGYARYAAAIRDANLVEADVLHGLTADEVDTLADLLQRVITGLDEVGLDEAGLTGTGRTREPSAGG